MLSRDMLDIARFASRACLASPRFSSHSRNHMNPQGIAVKYFTILRKEVVRILRIWSQTLLPPVITMGLYYVIFGTFIVSQIADMQGVSYIQFIVPGLVMMSVITNAYANVVSTFFGAKFMHNLE